MLSWPSLLYIFWADLQGCGRTSGQVSKAQQQTTLTRRTVCPKQPEKMHTFYTLPANHKLFHGPCQTIQHANVICGNATLCLAMLHHNIKGPAQTAASHPHRHTWQRRCCCCQRPCAPGTP